MTPGTIDQVVITLNRQSSIDVPKKRKRRKDWRKALDWSRGLRRVLAKELLKTLDRSKKWFQLCPNEVMFR